MPQLVEPEGPLFISGYSDDVIADLGVVGEDVEYLQRPFGVDDQIKKFAMFWTQMLSHHPVFSILVFRLKQLTMFR